ncbi:hypothetical protein ACFV4M_30785 [Kitasatospora indigofera]|uniref:hypothetical protein n=1 Tax=Kitasatospora indigofera TaxID=67307 RepID=UPI003650D78B
MEQRFTAPTGFRFVGAVSYGYYYAPVRPYNTGNLPTPTLLDGGRTLTLTSDLHLNTDPTTDKEPVQYTVTLQALPGAAPGTYADGKALIGPDGSFGATTITATVE